MDAEVRKPKKKSLLSFVIFLVFIWVGARLIGDWLFTQDGSDAGLRSVQPAGVDSDSPARKP